MIFTLYQVSTMLIYMHIDNMSKMVFNFN